MLSTGLTKRTLGAYLDPRDMKGLPSSQGTRYTSGKLWPHGEWSYGYARTKGDGGQWHEDVKGVSVRAEQWVHEQGLLDRSALDLSVPANSHTPKRRGLNGMTGYGQQMVKAAGHLMQRYYPHHRKTLGTITLPRMSQDARREVVAAWPEIVRQLLQWQSRQLRRKGIPQVVVSVSEIQPGRYSASGEACLHLHQLWLNAPAKCGHWSFSPNEIRSYFDALLRRVAPSYEGGYVNVDTRPVDGTVAAYLAKYMSKGKQQIEEALEDWGEDNCPRTWWNMTKAIRDAVKAELLKGPQVGAKLEETLELAWSYGVDECYAFLMPIMLDIGEEKRLMGWRGRMLRQLDSVVRSALLREPASPRYDYWVLVPIDNIC